MVMVSHRAQLAVAQNEALSLPLVEVQNLSKHFGGLRAIAGVSFTVRQGEMIGVIGPNGSGKTTLFALLSGFLPPTGGKSTFKVNQLWD